MKYTGEQKHHTKATIIGGGPTGLTVAWYLSLAGIKSTIIEADTVGGCHRVTRTDDGLFTEHSPRVYTTNQKEFFALLRSIGTSSSEIFEASEAISVSTEALRMKQYLSMIEMTTVLSATLGRRLGVKPKSYYDTTSVLDFAVANGFSFKAKVYFDYLCRKTDGRGIRYYSMEQFLALTDRPGGYLVGLRVPTDHPKRGFVQCWKDRLLSTGLVDIREYTKVVRINERKNEIYLTEMSRNTQKTHEETYTYETLVIAVPPMPMCKLLTNSKLENIFSQDIKTWSERSHYDTYVAVTVHYKNSHGIDANFLNRMYDLTPWGTGLVYINDPETKSIIASIAAGWLNTRSPVTGKTINETNSSEELASEIYRQTEPYISKHLGKPYAIVLSPDNYYDEEKKEWKSTNDAFFNSVNTTFLPMKSSVKNIYTAGPHTGMSKYEFTSIEQAVSNGKYLAGILIKSID